jgi:hypothetical protein
VPSGVVSLAGKFDWFGVCPVRLEPRDEARASPMERLRACVCECVYVGGG